MKKDVKETSIISTVVDRLKSEEMILFHSNQFMQAGKCILFGAVKFLANTKFENEVALRINDKNGVFIIAVVLEKVKDDEGKDSFEARFETNEECIKDIATVYDLTDEEVQRFINRFMYSISNNKFVTNDFVYKVSRVMFSAIINFLLNLGKNEVDEDGYEVAFDEYLTATATDEDGKHAITLEPSTDLKKFIKDDSLIDVE